MLKGIFEGFIKIRNAIMFTRTYNITNNHVAPGATLIQVVVTDKESAATLLEPFTKQRLQEAKEKEDSESCKKEPE